MLTIDRIKREDLDDLAGLYCELVGEETNLNKMKKNFIWMEENPNYIILGAKKNEKVVGSVMGIICRDLAGECKPFMVIENVVVSTEYRGKSIGTKLMKGIEEIARDRNCYYTIFVSASDRKSAHKFYESFGYKLDAVQGFKKYL
jgi:ribosomal protein S18 acetylase RimI-like enzyme